MKKTNTIINLFCVILGIILGLYGYERFFENKAEPKFQEFQSKYEFHTHTFRGPCTQECKDWQKKVGVK